MSTAAHPPDPIHNNNVPLPALEQLPDDPETLKRMIVELLATLHQERRDKDELRQRLQLLLRRFYGPRSERFHPDQPLLFADSESASSATSALPAAEPAPAQPDQAAARRRRQGKPHGRRLLPENLPRRPLHHELSEAERVCLCGQLRVDIGTDMSEQLDWQPASYFIWQHLTHKYACLFCARKAAEGTTTTTEPTAAAMSTSQPAPEETSAPTASATPAAIGPVVVSAAKPAMPIDKGLPGPGLLAHIIVSKYFDHLPLYRQEKIFERQGVVLARSTTCDWMAACADLLRPLYEQMVAAVLQSLWLHTDDTPVKNLGHEPGTTATARFWIYWGDRNHPYNVFDFTVNRKRDGPQSFLANFHGYLHADAFSGYDVLYLPAPGAGAAPIIEVACNAHARRKFYEARGSDAAPSHQALAYYAQLYELERSATENNFDDGQRLQMRRDLAVPILDRFHAWLEQARGEVLPKSPMGEAIGYALNNWTALIRYTEAGFLAIDNNVAEREMKRIAIGRKNWLFVGSDKGGQTAAVLFSFTSTCQRLAIEPWAYLQDVLTRLPRTPADRLVDLLPDRWQAARQQAARQPDPAL
jgi:transposase